MRPTQSVLLVFSLCLSFFAACSGTDDAAQSDAAGGSFPSGQGGQGGGKAGAPSSAGSAGQGQGGGAGAGQGGALTGQGGAGAGQGGAVAGQAGVGVVGAGGSAAAAGGVGQGGSGQGGVGQGGSGQGGAGQGGSGQGGAGEGGAGGCAGVDTQSDPANCGACGKACAGGDLCCDGACVGGASCQFAVTQVEPPMGWVSGGQYFTVKGYGFAKGMQVRIGGAVAPTLVIDDKTARVQSPPGPAGAHDVEIALNGGVSSLKNGFTYATRGISTEWTKVPLSSVRANMPGLAVMQDRRVLIVGGATNPNNAETTQDTADIFLPDEMKTKLASNKMSTPRWIGTATTLLDGRVLVLGGGCNPIGYPSGPCPPNGVALGTKADLFDPTTDSFTPSQSNPGVERVYPHAVLLGDGRVFIMSSFHLTNCELYDPATDTFTVVPHDVLHTGGFVVRLRDGRVLLGGGDGGSKAAELYDPATGQFEKLAPMAVSRSLGTAVVLPDGRVMIAGGTTLIWSAPNGRTDTIEFFDPATKTFSLAPYTMSEPRQRQATSLLADGSVLQMGGYATEGNYDPSKTVDQVFATTSKLQVFSPLPDATSEWGAVTGHDGSVVGVGGGAYLSGKGQPFVYVLLGKQ